MLRYRAAARRSARLWSRNGAILTDGGVSKSFCFESVLFLV